MRLLCKPSPKVEGSEETATPSFPTAFMSFETCCVLGLCAAPHLSFMRPLLLFLWSEMEWHLVHSQGTSADERSRSTTQSPGPRKKWLT